MLEHLSDKKLKTISVLILSPTRELADQTNQTIKDLGKWTKTSSIPLYGGVSKKAQDKKISKGVDVVVACPGRLLDHIREETISLKNVDLLIVDEADTMFDMGFLPDIKQILTHLPDFRQTLFFAATMPSEIKSLTAKILKNPEYIQIGVIAPAKTVRHSLYKTTDKLKDKMLLHLLEYTATGQVIVFTRTKRRARFLAETLEKEDYRVVPLQGNMSQNKRTRAIDGFKKGQYDILVATDIASRGIDVSDVTHVVNFDMPNTVDTYIHRIGRTGRAQNQGEAYTFSVPDDDGMIRRIEKVLGETIERRILEDFDYGGFAPNKNSKESTGFDSNNKTTRYSNRRKSFSKGRSNSGTKSFRDSESRFEGRRSGEKESSSRSGYKGRSNSGTKSFRDSESKFKGRRSGEKESSSRSGYKGRSNFRNKNRK